MKNKEFYIIDAHQDIAENCMHLTGKNFFELNELHQGSNSLGLPVNNQSDFFRLKAGTVKIVFGVVFPLEVVSADGRVNNDHVACYEEAKKQIEFYRNLEASGSVRILDSIDDYNDVMNSDDLIGVYLLMEGAEAISESLNELDEFYSLGVRALGPVWNLENCFAGGINSDSGLKSSGKLLIKKMEELGMVLDCAHMNEKSFLMAVENKPSLLINSHVCCKSLNDIPRNISDKEIKAIGDLGGVVCIAAHPGFAADDPTLNGIYKHILHAISIVGEDCVAIGTDFDGTSAKTLVDGLSSSDQLKNLADLILLDRIIKSPEMVLNKNLNCIIVNSLAR